VAAVSSFGGQRLQSGGATGECVGDIRQLSSECGPFSAGSGWADQVRPPRPARRSATPSSRQHPLDSGRRFGEKVGSGQPNWGDGTRDMRTVVGWYPIQSNPPSDVNLGRRGPTGGQAAPRRPARPASRMGSYRSK